MIVSILESPPHQIPDEQDLPPGLLAVIHRALTKDRAARYQKATDLLKELQAVQRSLGFSPEVRPAPVQSQPGHSRVWIFAAAAACLIAALAAFWWWGMYGEQKVLGPSWFQFDSAHRVTFKGDVLNSAITPDAKHLAYVSGTENSQTLTLRDLPTGAERTLAPVPDRYIGLTFSHDSETLYYVLKDPQREFGRLFSSQIKDFGTAAASMVLEDIDGPIAFSPNGHEFAFLRISAEGSGTRNSILLAHDGDPKNARPIVTLLDTKISEQLAWSPRNDWIAAVTFPGQLKGAKEATVCLFALDGTLKYKSSPQELRSLSSPVALDHGSLLAFSGIPQGAQQKHLVQFFVPTRTFHEVASDILGFESISTTADSRTLASVRQDWRSSIWVVPSGAGSDAHKLVPDAEHIDSLAWMDGSALIFPSARSGSVNLSTLDPDGSVHTVSQPENCVQTQPAVVPATSKVVYSSNCAHGGADFSLWLLDRKRKERHQLTSGSNYDYEPDVSADGKWIVYTSWIGNVTSVWKLPVDGGIPRRLSPKQARAPFLSPDGTRVVCQIREPYQPWRIAILSFPDGKLMREFPDLPVEKLVRWSPDGQALDYVTSQNGSSGIWRRPLSGDSPHQLTQIAEDTIDYFAWDKNGSKLAYIRGREQRDVVLFARR